jgi:hypothetical protein
MIRALQMWLALLTLLAVLHRFTLPLQPLLLRLRLLGGAYNGPRLTNAWLRIVLIGSC